MIAYDLQCDRGHRFEGWFKDADAYEQQLAERQITCPVCNSGEVIRIPSTFAIRGQKGEAVQSPRSRTAAEAEVMARAVMTFVENQFDNVGPDFATEALKMHYGVNAPRNIRGTSTAKEEETLRQEGVEFFKMPLSDIPPDKPTPSDTENR